MADHQSDRLKNLSPAKRALLLQQLRRESAHASTAQRIPRRSIEEQAPLSFAQQRLWFLDQWEPGSPLYNISAPLLLRGELDLAALEQSLDALVARHESLRTTFVVVGGEPCQQIAPRRSAPLSVVDLRSLPAEQRAAEAQRHVTQEAQQPFDLAVGPLFRATVLLLAERESLAVLTLHHIISDGWSMGVLIHELTAYYTAACRKTAVQLPELPIQYADYAVWQRQSLQGAALEAQLDYWRRQLAQAPATLDLLPDRPRPAVQTFNGAITTFTLAPDLSARVTALSRAEGVTLFMTLLAAFQALLLRYTGQQRIVVGTDVANRSQPEVEGLIGFFVNTLVLHTDLGGNPTFREALRRVREVTTGAFAHQDLPFERLVAALQPDRNPSYHPFFQIMFAHQVEPAPVELPGLTIQPLDIPGSTAKFDLTLVMVETGAALNGVVEYNSDLFQPQTIARLAEHYQILLSSAVAEPDTRIAQLPLLTAAERARLEAWTMPAALVPFDRPMHRIFEQQAASTPDAPAVIYGDEQLTYTELNARANQLAHWLQSQGLGRCDRIGVFGERGVAMLELLLASAKAGCTYVPLDPRQPNLRIATTIADSDIRLLATQQDLLTRSLELAAGRAARMPIFCWDELLPPRPAFGRHEILQQPVSNLNHTLAPHDVANIFYTSGSTGQPKGAMVEQIGMLNHLLAKIAVLELDTASIVAQNAAHSFDISIWQFLAALLVGGRVVIYPDAIALDPAALLAAVHRDRVTVLETVPTMLVAMLDDAIELATADMERPLGAFRYLISNAETLPVPLCRRWLERFPHVPIINTYGATECSDDTTHVVLRASPASELLRVPVGTPIRGFQIYVVDAQLQPVPTGLTGQIAMAGVGVGQGYLNDPAKTALAFTPNPFGGPLGNRLYLTGDLGRWNADGLLEFIGRRDGQVKVRGHRVELGEIEAVLQQHPLVSEAVVVVRPASGSDQQVVAYVVPQIAAHEPPPLDSDQAERQITQWQTIFDEMYRQPRYSQHDPALNLAVWVSSYTGQPFPEAEIFECIDATTERIQALQPRRILEIGCGTGLIFKRLAATCSAYWATDVSGEALAQLEQHLGAQSQSLTEIRLLQRAADQLDGLSPLGFDTIILNEVVQYFPNIDYLARVIASALRCIQPGGAIFIGDLRSYALLEAFHTSVQLHQAPDSLPIDQLKQRIRQHLAQEKELAIDPAFFTAFQQRYPQISSVEIQLKGGRSYNEITKFRYDVTLRMGAPPPRRSAVITLDWQSRLNLAAVRQILADKPPLLRIMRVPNARLLAEAATLELLAHDAMLTTVADLRQRLKTTLAASAGIDPADLWALGRELAYETSIAWHAGGSSDFYDVIFSQPGMAPKDSRPIMGQVQSATWAGYANIPARAKPDDRLIPKLHSYAQQRLPQYMIPTAFVLLNELPLNANGKVDRKRLPSSGTVSHSDTSSLVAPRDTLEYQLRAIFEQVLQRQPIGATDNFFHLGGHSLLAVRLIAQINKQFGLNLSLMALFQNPTIAGLASMIRHLDRAASSSPLVVLQQQGVKPPLICVHPAGGGVLAYTDLVRYLGLEQPVYGLQTPGLYDQRSPLTTIEALAACYIDVLRSQQFSGPYLLAGWSMGGLVAFEMAQQLQRDGQDVPLLALLDTWAPVPGAYASAEDDADLTAEAAQGLVRYAQKYLTAEQLPTLLSADVLRQRTRDEQAQYLLDLGRSLNRWPSDVGLAQMQRYLEIYKINTSAVRAYRPQSGYSGPLQLFRATDISLENLRKMEITPDLSDTTMGWRQLTIGEIEIVQVPASHDTIIEEPAVQVIARELQRYLAALGPTSA